jgi:hypothetical protein
MIDIVRPPGRITTGLRRKFDLDQGVAESSKSWRRNLDFIDRRRDARPASHCGGGRMAAHKFRVGQKVQLVPTLFERYAPAGDYVVVLQLPDAYGEFYYRIRSPNEPHDGIVKESQLRKWLNV